MTDASTGDAVARLAKLGGHQSAWIAPKNVRYNAAHVHALAALAARHLAASASCLLLS